MAGAPPIVITRWASQAGRRRPALEPGYVRIDERSFQELLAFATEYGKLVRFVDTDGNPDDGDWFDFFMADSATLLARMAAFDTAARAEQFHELRRQLQHESSNPKKLDLLGQLFQATLALPAEVDAWYAAAETLRAGTSGPALHRFLASAIGRELAPLLRQLRAYGAGASAPGALGQAFVVDPNAFCHIWHLGQVCPNASIYRGHFMRQKIEASLGAFAALFNDFLDAVTDLTAWARREFDDCLDDPHHKPHIALFMAFVRAFATAQDRLNALPARLIDFYYRDFLGEKPRVPVPDRVFLCFTSLPRPNSESVAIPATARFPAGNGPDGQPIVFAAGQSLAVTSAQLVQLRTLRVIRGALVPTASPIASDPTADRLLMVVTSRTAVREDGAIGDGTSSFPVFGVSATGDIGGDGELAPLGFAIASPALLLTSGQRRVSIDIRTADDFLRTILQPLLQRIATATGLAPDVALKHALAVSAFRLSVSGAAGWRELAQFDLDASLTDTDCVLSFKFTLPPDAPALVSRASAAAGDALSPSTADAGCPAVLVQLTQDAVTVSGNGGTVEVYPLALLDGMPVAEIVIDAAVIGLQSPQIMTPTGLADANTPFLPFAAPARVGAAFDIRHPELFAKIPQRIGITLRWLELPADPNGFAGYYAQYLIGADGQPVAVSPFTNDVFRATLTIADGGPWTVPAQSIALFGHDASGKLDAATTLEIQPVAAPAPPPLAQPAIHIALSEPAFGFGDQLYPINIQHASATIAAAAAAAAVPAKKSWLARLLSKIKAWLAGLLSKLCIWRWWQRLHKPAPVAIYPNPPWIPQVANVAIDYETTSRSAPGDLPATLLHLLPSGELVQGLDHYGGTTLLPNIAEADYLDLGLSGLGTVQPLTLLFQMTGGAEDAAGGVTRRAFVDGAWRDLRPDEIRRDDTQGLRNSGIVSLLLPALTPDLGSDKLCWLRAVPLRSPDSFPALLAVRPHALLATRIIDASADPSAPVPPKTITASLPPVAGIAKIDQPLPSFGGRAGESAATLPVRLGERLRHKARASLAWDYERLVLERFSEIAKVRVLRNRGAAGTPAPGELLAVVIPRQDDTEPFTPMPRTSLDTRARIRDGLAAIASPFACIHVVEPVYTCIAVEAEVIFRSGAEGDGPQQLGAELCAFLSPSSEGLDLADNASRKEIRAAIAFFIETRPYVAGLSAPLRLSFDPDPRTLPWCVPASAARHVITAVAADLPPAAVISDVLSEPDYAPA
jgi:hypothetical protein